MSSATEVRILVAVDKGVPFFDRKRFMLNVAVSRAMDSFVVIGDMRLFRRKERSPSAVLGSLLFADDARELPDVDGNHRFSRELLVRGERISTLERHREVLRHALMQARAPQIVLIASPWITVKAVEDDKLSPPVATGDTVAPVVQSALEEYTKLTARGVARSRSPASGRAAPVLPAGEPAP